jgi:flagella basal body P-ring formation protein FlgA
MMTRFTLLSLIYALFLAAFMLAVTARTLPALAAGEAEPKTPVALADQLKVRTDVIRLGDLFEPAGRYADRAVARAPGPGESAVLEAVWLWKLARAYGIDWKPESTFDTVTVTRPARTVTTGELREMVRRALFERTGEDDLIAIDLDDETAELRLAEGAVGAPQLARFTLEKSSGRFTAVVTGPPGPEARRQITLGGRAVPQIEVAVPVRRIAKGDILRARDLEIVRLPAARVSRSAIVDPADMVGLEAGRTLAAGRPVPASSVGAPELVTRNARVTIVLETANMRLTALGRAMESGAEGEIVRVQNLQSRITIDAVVSGENRVEADLPARLAANGGKS